MYRTNAAPTVYRTDAKPTVHVQVVKPKSFWCNIQIKFWVILYRVFKNSFFKKKMIVATLSGIPKEMFYCVDCKQEDCICPDWSQYEQ